MDKKAWIIFSVIVVALLGGLVYLSSKNKVDVSNVNTDQIFSASEQNGNIADHVFGKKDSKVVLVEYGDFQCPGCAGAHTQIKAISEEYEDRIAFVFRNFPLTTIHPNARAAAAAAEAAGLQGKYWEMYNIIYESQDNWKDASATERDAFFTQYAIQAGVNKDKYASDLASTSISKKITFDQALGKKLNISGTPTFYLNSTLVDSDVTNNIIQSDGSQLKSLIDEALKK